MVWQALIYAAILVASHFASKLFGLSRKAGDRFPSREYLDLQYPTFQHNAPLSVAFGRNKLSGNYVWLGNRRVESIRRRQKGQVWFENHYYADWALAFSEGQISSVRKIWLNDKAARAMPGNTTVSYLGTATQTADAQLVKAIPQDTPYWRNTAYIFGKGNPDYYTYWSRAEFHLGLDENALPDVEVEFEGLVLPHLGSYSNNPAHVIKEYLLNADWGMGIPASLLDDDSFTDVADYCDEIIETFASPNTSFSVAGDLNNYDVLQSNATVSIDAGLKIQVTSGNLEAHGRVLSDFILTGDFDIQMQYQITSWPDTPRGCQDDFYLGVVDGQDNILYISRLEGYLWPDMIAVYLNRRGAENGQWEDHMTSNKNETSGTGGFLRITREVDVMKFYHKVNAGDAWTQKTDISGSKTQIVWHGDNVKVQMGFRRWLASGFSSASVPVEIKVVGFTLNSGGGSNQKRFRLDYAITEVEKHLDHLEKMLASFGGFLTYSNGKILLKIDRAEASVYGFNMANIVAGSITWNQLTPVSELPSHLRVEFIDAGNNYRRNYAEAHFDWIVDRHAYLQEELALLGIRDYHQAWRMAHYYLRLKHYLRLGCAFKTGTEGLLLDAGDVITISHDAPKWNKKEFRITAIKVHDDDTLTIEATEYSPAVYEIPGVAPANVSSGPGQQRGESFALPSRLRAFESMTASEIELTFALPQSSGSWAGMDLYKELDGSGIWTYIGRAFNPTSSGLLESAIGTSDTDINMYDLLETITDNFAEASRPYKVRIEDEIIEVKDYSTTTELLGRCVRGIDATSPATHAADSTVSLLVMDPYIYTYTQDEIGHTIRFRGISLDNKGNELNNANPLYSNTITINGNYYLPWPPDLLEIEGQGNNVKYAGGDLMISWYQRNKTTDGYGNHGYGNHVTGYGGDTFNGFQTNYVRVYVDGIQVRETTTTGTTFTYTEAQNISDNGSLRKDLTFRVLQQVNNDLGVAAVLTTTPA